MTDDDLCSDYCGHMPEEECMTCGVTPHAYGAQCVCDVCFRVWWETEGEARFTPAPVPAGQLYLF